MRLPFYFLWAGQSFATVAGSLTTMALIALVYNTTGSATFAASVSLVGVLAKFTSSLLAPLIFDRFRLQSILLLSQTAEMLMVTVQTLLVTLFFSPDRILLLYLVIYCTRFFNGWAVSSRTSLVPRLVQENKLVKANSLISTTEQTLGLLGWTAGGMMLVYLSERHVLWLTVGLLFLSAVTVLFIQDDHTKQTGKRLLRWISVKEGWAALFQHPQLRKVTIMDTIEGIAGGIWIGGILLVFVEEVLHRGEEWWGYINASYFVGAIMGGLVVMTMSKFIQQRLVASMIVGSFGVCFLIFAFALTDRPLLALLLALVMGPFYQIRDIAQRTYFQKHTPLELQPKVFAAQSSLYYAIFSASVFVMGAIADLLEIRLVYLTAGSLYLTSSIVALFSKEKEQGAKEEIHTDQRLL